MNNFERKNSVSLKLRGRKRSLILRLIFYFLETVFFGALIYILFFSPFLAVSTVKIVKNSLTDQQLFLEKINSQMEGKILNVFDRKNIILVSGSSIEKNILEEFKQVKSVKVSKKFPSILEVTLIERTPTLILCNGDICFILDEIGEAYEEIDPSSEAAKKNNPPVVTDESRKEINVGKQMLDSKYLNYVVTLKNRLADELDLETENNFRTPSLVSEDLRIKTQAGWSIYFSQKIEVEKEMEVLKAILADIISKDQRADLEYVDLRIDNKIYYKFRDGTPSEIERKKTEEDATAPAPVKEDKKEKKKD